VNSAKSFEILHTATERLQVVTEPVIQFWEVAKQNCLINCLHLL